MRVSIPSLGKMWDVIDSDHFDFSPIQFNQEVALTAFLLNWEMTEEEVTPKMMEDVKVFLLEGYTTSQSVRKVVMLHSVDRPCLICGGMFAAVTDEDLVCTPCVNDR